MNVFEFTSYIYAENADEVKEFEQAFIDFINEHRSENRAVTAKKLANALREWKTNAFVRTQIINYLEQ